MLSGGSYAEAPLTSTSRNFKQWPLLYGNGEFLDLPLGANEFNESRGLGLLIPPSDKSPFKIPAEEQQFFVSPAQGGVEGWGGNINRNR